MTEYRTINDIIEEFDIIPIEEEDYSYQDADYDDEYTELRFCE